MSAALPVERLRLLVQRAESEWRHAHLPLPSRDTPRPAPAALDSAARLEQAGRMLDRIAGRLRNNAASADSQAAIAEHAGFLLAILDDDRTRPLDPAALHASILHLDELVGRAG